MTKMLTVFFTVMILFSSCAHKENIVSDSPSTKYDITVEGFQNNIVEGMMQSLSRLPFYSKHNVLELKDGMARLTYTSNGGDNDVVNISSDIEKYFKEKSMNVKVDYTSGMFSIKRVN